MSELILHHYPNSPFSEKIRTMFGFKRLTWKSVMIPSIMPKPDVTALTGGYRRTPLMQIGADVYCDTALICDVLEARYPDTSIYPKDVEPLARTLAQWADYTLFWTAIPYALQPAGSAHMFGSLSPEERQAFLEDRTVFRALVPRMRAPEAQHSMRVYLERIDAILADKPFLLGTVPSIADFSFYHCLWFVAHAGPLAGILESFTRVRAWYERMKSFGHGTSERLTSAAALDIARNATPAEPVELDCDVHGFELGDPVEVSATDYGTEPVRGELYSVGPTRISVAREDPRAGRVVVHFPRLGFEMRRAK
jgi:glutathione S-transferase